MTAAARPGPPRVKPKLRGVLHELGFYASLVLAAPTILLAEPGEPRAAAAIFAGCVAACFGVSALYHRPTWPPRTRAWLARLDHAGAYFLIAGTYTPVALLVLTGAWSTIVLVVVWSGATAAALVKLLWVRAPKWLSALFGLALGWFGATAIFPLLALGVAGLGLLMMGGVFYSAGAVIYWLRRPDPIPHLFGYHELFHLLTLLAAAAHYAATAFFVLPSA